MECWSRTSGQDGQAPDRLGAAGRSRSYEAGRRSKAGRAARAHCDVPATLDEAQQQQIDHIYQAHGRFLRRLAQLLCRSSADSEDLVQETLERSMRHCHRLGAASNPRAWMVRVMRNLFVDRLRRRRASPALVELDDETPAPCAEPSAWWEKLESRDIATGLGQLPDEQRQAFELFAFEGCSYAAIASRVGIAKMTAGTRILRARRRLRQVLIADHGPER
jgi:RNA polymerase sigma-70 factor (ECF subfamily)